MNWLPDALAFAAACAAGAVNAVAGGGTLISFPALVWLGLPPITANATNAVAIWPGSLGAMWGYRAELRTAGRWVYVLVAPSLAGGFVGAVLLRLTPTRTFDRLVPLLILFATLLFMAQEPLQRRFNLSGRPGSRSTWLGGVAVFQFFVSLYGGYFGAGIGILMLAALAVIGLDDVHQMNGVKNLLALCINGVATIYFVWMRMVSWPHALLMALGAVVGGIGGARVARRLDRRTVRRIIVGIGFSMALALASRR
jgi:uncharacterized membrane protein YfcA